MTEPTRRWSIGTITAAIVIFFAVLTVARFLWFARSILVVTFLGILFGLALTAGVDTLQKRGVRRGIGAVFITLAVLGTLVGIGAMIAPTLRQQVQELKEQLPQSIDQIERWMGSKGRKLAETVTAEPAAQSQGQSEQQAQTQTGTSEREQSEDPLQREPASQPPDKIESQSPPKEATAQQSGRQSDQKPGQTQARKSLREELAAPLRSIGKFLFPFISATFAAAMAIILTVFIALYIAIEPDLYRQGVLHLAPRTRRQRFNEVLDKIEDSLRRWLIARLLAMLAIGGLTTVVLMLLKVRAAVALGVLAGILEFVPFFGPLVSALPAIGIALLDSPQKALWVTLAFLVIQQIEGNVVTPMLLKNRVHIPPVLTIVAVASLGAVMGVEGMIIAEPLVVVAMILVQMFYVEDVIGDKLPESS